MDKLVIRGGNPLLGTVRISGAKNAALPCMAAALLTDEPVILENIPQVRDIETTRKLLAAMGAEVELGYGRAQHRTTICARTLSAPEASYELVKTMRASTLVLGPLVARCGRARVSLPGGCAIGARPIDLHIKGLERLGAKITQEHGNVEATTDPINGDRLKGAEILFDKITVTGTEDLLMAATLADGETVMQNCACEPEVADLAALLNAMGAKIQGAGTSTIRVKGVTKLHGARHRIIPDRIEAGTFILAGALTGGDLNVAGCDPAHLTAILQKLAEAGVKTVVKADSVRVMGDQPLHARAGTGPHGCEHQDRRPPCHRPRWNSAERRRRSRLRPARLRLARTRGAGRGRRDYHRPRLSPGPRLREHRRKTERHRRRNPPRRQHLSQTHRGPRPSLMVTI